VLADSLYGESDNFIEALNHHQLSFVVAIRSNHSVLMPPGARFVQTGKVQTFRMETRKSLSKEIFFGKRRTIRYWQITTDKLYLPQAQPGML